MKNTRIGKIEIPKTKLTNKKTKELLVKFKSLYILMTYCVIPSQINMRKPYF
jgi:hypothetical protein